MRALEVDGLRAGYGTGPDVITDVGLDVHPGEVVALLGASGSGKSTLLRCIAGLHPPREGRVAVGGLDVSTVPVERRGIGFVFQDHALFPHRDVAGNVAFGPRMQRAEPADVRERVTRALADVGLSALAQRAVDELSGGEQQRVALARALAARPRLLLLDEPYGSLDRPLRERLASELPTLVRAQGIGALLVTHDQQEALRAADRIAVMIDGSLRQLAAPAALWRDPVDAAVAAFLGVGALLTAEVRSGVAHGAFGSLPLPTAADGRTTVLVPHAALTLSPRPSDALLEASIVEVRFAGDHHRVEARLADGSLVIVRVDEPGTAVADRRVTLGVGPAALRAFPGQRPASLR
jgi:thiamine transport system ATP-binding protein